MRIWTVIVALVAGMAAPGSAWAQTGKSTTLPTVYLVPVQGTVNVSSLIPRRMTVKLTTDLKSQQGFELLAAIEAPAGRSGAGSIYAAGPGATPDQRQASRAALAEGKQAFRTKRYGAGLGPLMKAVKGFSASGAYIDSAVNIAEAYGYLGLTLYRLNKAALGRSAIEAAFVLDPAIKLWKVKGITRGLKRTVIKIRSRTLKRRKGQIVVNVEPKGAWVFVDGDEKGKAPFVVKDVIPGRHYISARLPGRHSRAMAVDVKPGQVQQITLTLPTAAPRFKQAGGLVAAFQSEIVKRLQNQFVDRRMKPLAAQFAKRVKADFLVLGAVQRGDQGGYKLRSYLFRRRDKKLVELDAYTFDGELLNLTAGVAKVADAVEGAVGNFPAKQDITFIAAGALKPRGGRTGRTGGLIGVNPAGEKTVHRTEKPWYRKGWFIGLMIGIVVVGAAVGGGVGISSYVNQSSAGYKVRVTLP